MFLKWFFCFNSGNDPDKPKYRPLFLEHFDRKDGTTHTNSNFDQTNNDDESPPQLQPKNMQLQNNSGSPTTPTDDKQR